MARSGNHRFQFKHFEVYQDRCAMKVGTDGILLGTWATPSSPIHRMLDVGTGTGLISLIWAQRFAQSHIDAIEIDADAAKQAQENVLASPWADRVNISHADLQTFAQTHALTHQYDMVVSNPPFYSGQGLARNPTRQQARQGDLTPAEFMNAVDTLLAMDGRLAIIIPCELAPKWKAQAEKIGLYLRLQTYSAHTVNHHSRRVLLQFERHPGPLSENQIYIRDPDGQAYHASYCELMRDFLLRG